MNQLKRKRSYGAGVIKREANMFADTTGMTCVILYLVTTETETPKNMTKCDGVGMTQRVCQRSTPAERASGAGVVDEGECTG